MLAAVHRILERIFKQGPTYAKAGIMLFDLAPRSRMQSNLFDSAEEDAKRENLMAALDNVNERFGRGTLRFGSEGPAQGQADWRMRQERRSPRMTTSWDELPRANYR